MANKYACIIGTKTIATTTMVIIGNYHWLIEYQNFQLVIGLPGYQNNYYR